MRSIIALSILSLTLAAPLLERADGGNAYTGNGGSAVGGTNSAVNSAAYGSGAGDGLLENGQVLDMFSDNAGDGGKAKSGDSFGGHGSTSYAWVNGYWVPVGGKGGDAYTGLGGNANGGDKGEWNYGKRCLGGYCGGYGGGYGGYGYRNEGLGDNLKLANIASINAGDAGDASSGNAYGGSAGGY